MPSPTDGLLSHADLLGDGLVYQARHIEMNHLSLAMRQVADERGAATMALDAV